MIMDRAYEGEETRQLVLELGFTPVVPPKQTRANPWEYDRVMYRPRTEIEPPRDLPMVWGQFFNAPVPSGCTLTMVLSSDIASILIR